MTRSKKIALIPYLSAIPRPNANEKEQRGSGVDLVIFIEASREVVLTRSLGRLYDPVTRKQLSISKVHRTNISHFGQFALTHTRS